MRRSRHPRLMAILYTLMIRLAVPVMLLRLLWRSRKTPGYRARLGQRLALGLPVLPGSRAHPVWIHAVSVGETLAIAPLIEQLQRQYPAVPVLVTSTTPTGAVQVQRLFAQRVTSCWMPFDTPGAVRRFLNHFKPRLVALVETEIWPNLIAEAASRDIPVCLLNARLSARSARGYGRLSALSAPAVADIDLIAAQHRHDARRFRVLGARPEAVQVVGSVKYDMDMADLSRRCSAIRDQLGSALAGRRVFLAASTHPGEESPVLAAYRDWANRVPGALLILAPRHPERLAALEAEGLFAGWITQRRSAKTPLAPDTNVLLWDTLGELGPAMGLTELVFVGGSLVPHGGHNPLEAAVWGIPVITGPHDFNFAGAYRELVAVGAALRADNSDDLATVMWRLSADREEWRRRGAAGRQVVDSHRGAVQRQLQLLGSYLV